MPEIEDESWPAYYADKIPDHFTYYLAYAETYPRAIDEDYSILEEEHHNILSAIDNAVSCSLWQHVVRFGWSVCDPTKGYLRVRGYWSILNDLLPQMIVAAQNAQDEDAVQTFRQHYANMKLDMGDWETAEAIYHELLHHWQMVKDDHSVGVVMHQLGLLNQNIGKYAIAEDWYRQSLAVQKTEMTPLPDVEAVKEAVQELVGDGGPREISPTSDVNRALFGWYAAGKTVYSLGMVAYQRQDYEAAYQLCQQSLAIRHAMGDELGASKTYLLLGAIACQTGDLDESRQCYEKSLALKRKLGDLLGIANALHQLGILAQIAADYPKAESYYRESLHIDEHLANKEGIAGSFGQLANLYKEQNRFGPAETLYRSAISLSREIGDMHGLTLHLSNLAALFKMRGMIPEAIAVMQEVVDLDRKYDFPDLTRDSQFMITLMEMAN